MDWRIAAALTMITVGGLSVALLRRGPAETRIQPKDTVLAAAPIDSGPITPAPATNPPLVAPSTKRIDSAKQAVTPPRRTPAASPREQLAFSGGADDLDEATFRALLGALDEIDRAPVAPSAEPDRTPVLPVISKEGTR